MNIRPAALVFAAMGPALAAAASPTPADVFVRLRRGVSGGDSERST